MECELCGHVFGQKHRIIPGSWGGLYRADNVIRLCPNHHAAIHFLMVRWLRRQDIEPIRFTAYRADRALWKFWKSQVKPVCENHRTAMKRIRQSARHASRKVNRMTPGQFLRVIESARAWEPPLGVTTDVIVDSKRFKIHVHLVVNDIGRTLLIEDYLPPDVVFDFFESQTNDMAGYDLRAEMNAWLNGKGD